MTIWILHQKMTAQEEAQITEQTILQLPFNELPDLSDLLNKNEAQQMIKTLFPHEPPESINRRCDFMWNIFSQLHPEDIIVIPLPMAQEIVLAEITGTYKHQVGSHGEDIHCVPVKFYPKRTKLNAFRKHKEIFDAGADHMVEVTNMQARIAIRDQLPHSYNRFVKYKWLIGFFMLLSILRMYQRLTN